MSAIYLLGVIFLFLYLVISDRRSDMGWNVLLSVFWPVVLVFIFFLVFLAIFGFQEDDDDDPYRDCNR
jgi:energy-coupling factor transporter transmembrane protein EcfT